MHECNRTSVTVFKVQQKAHIILCYLYATSIQLLRFSVVLLRALPADDPARPILVVSPCPANRSYLAPPGPGGGNHRYPVLRTQPGYNAMLGCELNHGATTASDQTRSDAGQPHLHMFSIAALGWTICCKRLLGSRRVNELR